jgi:hypothetical protein
MSTYLVEGFKKKRKEKILGGFSIGSSQFLLSDISHIHLPIS